MSLRFYNPPPTLLARGNQEGADIGGDLSIIAMDKHHNLHVVENIYSELMWGGFWQELELEEEFENFTVKHQDDSAVVDNQELITRLARAFTKIRKNNWIFHGIGGFESNTFAEPYFVNLTHENVNKLKDAHRRIRNQRKFPVLLTDVSERSFIACMFHGNGRQYFHYPDNLDMFSIYESTKQIRGYVAGIVCTAQEAANFYILSTNIPRFMENLENEINLNTLEEAMGFIERNVIFPVSWFRINIGRNSLETLEHWKDIKDDEGLRFALKAYLHYVNTIIKEEHNKTTQK